MCVSERSDQVESDQLLVESESERILLPSRVLHQQGISLGEEGAYIKTMNNEQTVTIIYTI